jgi:deoxyribonuclease V
MKVCLDVQYNHNQALAAAILFNDWTDSTATRAVTLPILDVAEYESGAFYKRELPCLEAILETITEPLEYIIVDSFVYLDSSLKSGLGARLHMALEEKIPVIGVAKTDFTGAPSIPILRGESKQALFVSSIGCDTQRAAAWVQSMHGMHRIPTLLKAVDALARGRS